MNRNQIASLVIPVISIACLLGGGFLLQAKGQDQVTLSQSSRSATLSSDTVHVSFEQVGGKVTTIPYQEEKVVKKGDVLMKLDGTDVDLQIEQLQKQLQQFDTQIQQQEQSIQLGYAKATTQEKQAQLAIAQAQVNQSKSQAALETSKASQRQAAAARRQAESAQRQAAAAEKQVNDGSRKEDLLQQQIAVQSATKSLQTVQTSYERTKKLYDAGLSSKAEMDSADNALTLAKNQLSQQKEALTKMKNGATAEERQQANERTRQASEQANQATEQVGQAAVSIIQAQDEIEASRIAAENSSTQLDTVAQTRQQLADQELSVKLLKQQKAAQQVELKTLLLKKSRLILKAPQNGKITAVSTKVGENIAQGTPVITLETNEMYFDLYVSEDQASKFKANQQVPVHLPATNQDIQGKVRYITSAPQFANLRMSREKGEADIATFQVRIYVPKTGALLPGMTAEVNTDEITS
ncbi:HlyD family secretion protein [Paenibacillus dauci]|uniref:HlyD family secretion protein n=1 Tax=Paenibacillus dauci TaxID=1567106 RepID=UPI0006195CE2|nr:HlyD family efflux transporter periplasmic adaptor subunit [Paenibacillus dauci]